MIDTVKIYSQITKELYQKIEFCQTHKMSFNKSTGEIFYDVTSDSLPGSYSTNLSVRVGVGAKYGFINSYCIEIEGSLHKFIKGQNAYNGYYNLSEVALHMIKEVEKKYDVALPKMRHWFLNRVDISKCFDLQDQNLVVRYINSLKNISYPRRNVLSYKGNDIYISGTSTTLKMYNKLTEFIAHDKSKCKSHFDVDKHMNKIQGFVRFECEIKKKKLESITIGYRNRKNNRKQIDSKNIRLYRINYDELEKVWSDEFMKVLKFPKNAEKLEILSNREAVKDRLLMTCSSAKAMRLYNFFLSLKVEGYDKVKDMFSKPTFYRNISELKELGISWTSTEFDVIEIEQDNVYFINPFEMKEVL